MFNIKDFEEQTKHLNPTNRELLEFPCVDCYNRDRYKFSLINWFKSLFSR